MVMMVHVRGDRWGRCGKTDGWMRIIWSQDHESLREKACRSTRRPGGMLGHCAVVRGAEMLSLTMILVLVLHGRLHAVQSLSCGAERVGHIHIILALRMEVISDR